jgi:hypothetical protein
MGTRLHIDPETGEKVSLRELSDRRTCRALLRMAAAHPPPSLPLRAEPRPPIVATPAPDLPDPAALVLTPMVLLPATWDRALAERVLRAIESGQQMIDPSAPPAPEPKAEPHVHADTTIYSSADSPQSHLGIWNESDPADIRRRRRPNRGNRRAGDLTIARIWQNVIM